MIGMNKKQIEEKLKQRVKGGDIDNWKMMETSVKHKNHYITIDGKPESSLSSERHEFKITIYKKYQDGLGEGSFIQSESSSKEDFEKELDDAVFMTTQGKSKPYTVPEKTDACVNDKHIDYSIFTDNKYIQQFDTEDIDTVMSSLYEKLSAAVKNASTQNINIFVNYFECLNTVTKETLSTSGGIEKSRTGQNSYIEYCLTAQDTAHNKESEYIVYEKINDLLSEEAECSFEKNAGYAADSLKSKKAENFTGPVILSGPALHEFMCPLLRNNPLVAHASARFSFYGLSRFKLGETVLETKGDPLTLYSNPLMPGNAASRPFDADGVAAKRLCLIENNVCRNYLASKQYADYLGVEATGPKGVTEIELGTRTTQQLRSMEPAVEIVSFASFVPDSMSGHFSAEIRLGYYIKEGKRIPFKGGLFTGNVFDLAEHMYLSSSNRIKTGYSGPEAIRFEDSSIVGM